MITRKVSIIIPVIRPHFQREQHDLIKKNAGVPASQFEIVAMEDKARIGCPKMVSKMVERTKYDLVLFLGDDILPRFNFLAEALKEMGRFNGARAGLVALNDCLRGKDLAAHWLASKSLLPLIGGEFFSTEYIHCFCDWELTDKCRALGLYRFAKLAILEHHHPIFKKNTALMDADYRRVYSKAAIEHDREVYYRRMKEFQKANPRLKVMASFHD